MNSDTQYRIEILGQKKSSDISWYMLTGAAAEWTGEFGNCCVNRKITAQAIFKSWTINANYPVRISVAKTVMSGLVLYAKKGLLILDSESQKPVRIPSFTLRIQPQIYENLSLTLPVRGTFHFLSVNILEPSPFLDMQKIVPGTFLNKMLDLLFLQVKWQKKLPDFPDILLKLILLRSEDPSGTGQDLKNQPFLANQQIIEEMRERMILQLDEKFSVRQISGAHHIHPARLTGLFKKKVGLTPAAYQSDIRLQKARQLLMDDSRKIQDIALEIGFVNPGHFSKFFKTRTGVTPSHFRNRSRDLS